MRARFLITRRGDGFETGCRGGGGGPRRPEQGGGGGIFGPRPHRCRLSGAECKPGTRNGPGLAGWRKAGQVDLEDPALLGGGHRRPLFGIARVGNRPPATEMPGRLRPA